MPNGTAMRREKKDVSLLEENMSNSVMHRAPDNAAQKSGANLGKFRKTGEKLFTNTQQTRQNASTPTIPNSWSIFSQSLCAGIAARYWSPVISKTE
jgi:hypothetical protein